MNTLSNTKKIRAYLGKTIRAYLAGLTFDCPFGGGNPKDCICHELRKKPTKERIRILAAFTDEDCMQIFDRHRKCFGEKSRSVGLGKIVNPHPKIREKLQK
jgi:hypothetical protein